MAGSRIMIGAALLTPMVVGFLAPVSLHPATSYLVPLGRQSSGGHAQCRRTRPGVASVTSMAVQQQQRKQAIPPMTPRRKQFFKMVTEGLRVGFEGQDIAKVARFVQYCRGELDYEPQGILHQPSEEYVEGLCAKPWWEPEEFEWISKLEEKSDVVIDEFAAFWNDPMSSFARDSKAMDIMGKGWSGVRLQRLGDWIPENCGKFPNTVALLKELEIPLAVRGVMFARQVPGSGVSPHSDGRNFILTTHLGVDVPDDCWMRVGEKKRVWQNGKALVLDTSFEHETGNNSRRDRIVLIIDFWHPDLTQAEQEALAFVYDLRNRFESGVIPLDKEEGEGNFFGIIKKAFNQ